MQILLFDLMDTLIRDPFHNVIEDILSDKRVRDLWRKYKDQKSFEKFERGEFTEEEYARNFFTTDLPGHELNLPGLYEIKPTLFSRVEYLEGVEEILDELHPKVKKGELSWGIASNYGTWHNDVFAKLPSLPEYFQQTFFSCDLGIRKPEIGFYQKIQGSIEVQFGAGTKIFFADDRQTNLEPASLLGWKTHLVGGDVSLRSGIMRFLNE